MSQTHCHLLMQHASLILSNNKTKSNNFDPFLKEKNNFFEHPGFPPEVAFLSYFYQKDISGI